MSVFAAQKNGDMDTPDTFGGATTPGDGDEISLGGYTVSCASDKRALATGITISGTGKLLILAGGAFMTPVDIPETVAVQFGEPVGVGAGPLPAHGALDANASAELIINGAHKQIDGPCAIYTAQRTGKGWARVASKVSATASILDDAGTDWRAGDVVISIGVPIADLEYSVTGWDANTVQLNHAAMTGTYNIAGCILARASCAAHIRRIVNSSTSVLTGGLTGKGDLYMYSTGACSGIEGEIGLDGRLVTSHPHYQSTGHATNMVSVLEIGRYSLVLAAGGGVAKALQVGNTPSKLTLEHFCLANTIVPPAQGYPFDVTLISCDLPNPLITGALATGQIVRVLNDTGTSDVQYTTGGIATKVQHAELPGTTDLPDAYLLAPVTGRAYIDYMISVKRGQTVRLRYHVWLGGETAASGYDIYDADRQVPGLETPLQSFVLPEGDILEWHRPTPAMYHNASERDMVLRIRAWAENDNVYLRFSPEQGGGAL